MTVNGTLWFKDQTWPIYTCVLLALPKVNSFKLLVLHLLSFWSLDIDLDLNHNIPRMSFKQHSSLLLFLKLLRLIISFVSRTPSVRHHSWAALFACINWILSYTCKTLHWHLYSIHLLSMDWLVLHHSDDRWMELFSMEASHSCWWLLWPSGCVDHLVHIAK